MVDCSYFIYLSHLSIRQRFALIFMKEHLSQVVRCAPNFAYSDPTWIVNLCCHPHRTLRCCNPTPFFLASLFLFSFYFLGLFLLVHFFCFSFETYFLTFYSILLFYYFLLFYFFFFSPSR